MYDYLQGQTRALELLQFYGDAIQFVKKGTTGGYDDSGNVLPPQSDLTLDGTATPLVMFKASEVDGKAVLMGDGYLYFQGVNEPQVGMQVTLHGTTYRVISSYPIKSISGTKLFDKVHVRV